MKKILVGLLLLTACSNGTNSNKEATQTKEHEQMKMDKNKFEGVEFAVNKDLSCGMPLSAGVEDTAHYEGKIYGFCSEECKNDFLKNPQAYVTEK